MVETHGKPISESPFHLKVKTTPFVNFAMQQNAVPLLKTLQVKNMTESDLTDIRVRIWSDPPVFAERTFRVKTIGVGGVFDFPDTSITLLREPLRSRTEREEGHLWIEVSARDEQARQVPFPLSVLACNEWFGISPLPEILAAHIQPNDPAVEWILAAASRILDEKTGDASLQGYQTGDIRRVYAQVAAIYYAAARQNIRYINPPASFETTGQKIRTPSHLLDRKLGTCLDTSALLAACFEQAGLRSVMVLVSGHAFTGVWLVDKSFDDPIILHGSILLNRIDLGEFLVVESTGITKAEPPGFKIAMEQGRLNLQRDSDFHFALDIKAARTIGIRPLLLTESQTELDLDLDYPADTKNKESVESIEPDLLPAADESSISSGQESPTDRLAKWKMNLLDLSLRNRLINFKDSKKAIPLICPDIARLEDALAADEVFRVRPKPDTWGDSDPRNAALFFEQTGENPLTDYLRDEMIHKRLHAAIPERELASRLVQVERSARLGLEEGGANTLFLALGFLVWTETETRDIQRRAPILLIPMNIERKSVRDGFRIKRIDEESQINITLLQKLKVDFGIVIEGLDPLPEDESGLDVPRILRTFREKIKREPGWKVVDEASISIFTFSRFLMWLDLAANAELLKQNRIVNHLIENASELFEPEITFPELETLDEKNPPSSTFCPLPADSTQLRAILSAAAGHTFVLQGPPGTGKSQTITNLIAHCMTIGKRVLFVAQKRAALDVVYKRLTNIGLGPFCLELHSNKTTKESFRTQLREALSLKGTHSNRQWELETDRLAKLRQELNDYVRDLHQLRAFGQSAYWVISMLIAHENIAKVSLNLDDIEEQTAEVFQNMRSAIRDLDEATAIVGNPVNHPLGPVRLTRWVYGIEEDIVTVVEKTEMYLSQLKALSEKLLPDFSLDASTISLNNLKVTAEFTELLEKSPAVTQAGLAISDWMNSKPGLIGWLDLGQKCAENRSELLKTYADELFSLDLNDLIQKLHQPKDVWIFKRWRLESSVKKMVRSVCSDSNKPMDLDRLEKDLLVALSVVNESAELEKQSSRLSTLFDTAWMGLETDWDELRQLIDWLDRFHLILDQVPGKDREDKRSRREIWVQLATTDRTILISDHSESLQALRETLTNMQAEKMGLGTLLQLDVELAWGDPNENGMFTRTETTLNALKTNLSQLRQWSHYQTARARIVNLNLSEIADALELGKLKDNNLDAVFEHSFADWWARTVLKSVPTLAGFIGERHRLKIQEFRNQVERVTALAKKESFSRIMQGIPRVAKTNQRTSASSEAGLLLRFAQGGRKTIRRIFKDCPNALAKFKPCVLMSPLSVAQFIGADFPKFDLVVFDEASQMPTYEAIGAIARGNQLIVVGDSRQLPPTTFFERQRNDEEYGEDDLPEELESILEEVEAAGVRPLRLDWHYRSRHESLIAFSNRQYYENRLNTFPAAYAEHPRMGVRWCEVPDGVYDHGKTRTNLKEAEVLVEEIVRRLRDPVEQMDSLGVVTFSISQQHLVEDMLDTARNKHPEIETFFTNVEEPVFVKNLETVQGDERDVILFSICYGPDANGVIRMNFGPLNNKGGERRLNVAITRARKQLLVFSTLRPDQIDLSRTDAMGVQHLRAFLDYARRGRSALMGDIERVHIGQEGLLEKSIAQALAQDGVVAESQVGFSGYRVDLAVQDPDMPGHYLLGVEYDGANYRSAKSARDRDGVRPAVLKGLGWKLHRIWSTDWWLQRSKEIVKLKAAIEQARNDRIKIKAEDFVPSNRPTSNDNTQSTPPANPAENWISPERISAETVLSGQSIFTRYEPNDLHVAGKITDPVNALQVRELVRSIVNVEAPILFDSLCSRISAFWGVKRAGSRIQKLIMKEIIDSNLPLIKSGNRTFIWTPVLLEMPMDRFRVPDDESIARQANEICPEEIAGAARQILIANISMNEEDLTRETANIFGIRRLGTKVRRFIKEGIDLLKNSSRCQVDGDSLIAKDE